MGVKLSSSLINTISVTQHFFNAFYISEVANDNPFSLISTVVPLPLAGSHLHSVSCCLETKYISQVTSKIVSRNFLN